MKKIVSVMLVLVIMAAFSVGAFAATKEDVMNALSRPVITKYWETRSIPADLLNAAEKHLDQANFSAAELDTILGYIMEGRNLLENVYCEVSYNKLSASEQKKMMDLMNKAADAAKVEVTIKGSDVSFKSKITGESQNTNTSKPIQNTGANAAALAVAASALVVAAVAGAYVSRKNSLGK